MAAARKTVPKAPPVIERFIRQLLVTNKAVALYPPSSTIPRDTAEDAAIILREALREESEVRLVITKHGLFYEGIHIFPGQAAFSSFSHELYKRHLADVRFHAGIEASDIIALLEVAKSPVKEIASSGGFESRMWDLNVGTITVTEAQITLVDGGGAPETTDDDQPTLGRHEIDDLLSGPPSSRLRDHVTLARVISSPSAVREYLQQTRAESADPGDLTLVGGRFAELAQVALEVSPDDHDEFMRSLAEAIWELDSTFRRELLMEHVLPEARMSAPLAAVVHQMDIDKMCRMFVDGVGSGDVSQDALVRAIRNLALISSADREDVVHAAGAAMLGAGFGQSLVTDVLEGAVPSRLTVRERPGGNQGNERQLETIFRLLDLAPTPNAADDHEGPDVAALRDEARRGITDGDVIGALVSLVSMDTREAQFAATMSMLEDSLDLLIARGEIDVAADAAVSMLAAAEGMELTPAQKLRIQRAVERFSRPSDIREIATALRLYKDDTVEYAAARRLLDALGPVAIPPLLEQLADEPDMAARKAMVDLLSQLAGRYIPELGMHVGDQRWYFVRNVVGILGSTRSSAALPYLERTLRHSDPRVRRETIRGFATINDRLATEMLVAALSDEDAQNVQLAARYLGRSGAHIAEPALEAVARGDGRGNRENGPRVEAIEALGTLKSTQSLPVLEALAGRRKLIGASRARELRTAAESAISRIRSEGGAE